MKRRDLLKGLATVPVLGLFTYAWFKRRSYENYLKNNILDEIRLKATAPDYPETSSSGKKIRLGIIGYGGRGKHLLRAAGYAHPRLIDDWKLSAMQNSADKRYKDYLEQEDLNVVINGVCDIFEPYGGMAQEAGANIYRNGTGAATGPVPKRYRHYKDLIHAGDIDAVIIATPDHWHGPMAIEAARAGKHIYLEKPMTWTVEETYTLRDAVKTSGIVFQLGHQGRQTESYYKAKEAIENKLLGKISLVEVTTNRNDPNGAWVYPIHEDASPETIDWDQFIGQAPYHPFNPERFFRWRCWWDYSTGLSGDLMTHEYDAMNQILELGIPASVVSSGGIYYFKDGRTVPDVLHTVMEYPHRDLSLVYSATLANNRKRGRVIMGHDASMELGNDLIIKADPHSTRYAQKIREGIIEPGQPLFAFSPGMEGVDAITTPTEKYFAGRGLLYTYRGGKWVDPTFLHIKEWLNCIRNGGLTSCNIDAGFEEAITAHMGTLAYRENRKVHWDAMNEKII
jgi:predicted dehydrogenase